MLNLVTKRSLMNMLSGPIHTPPPLPTDAAVHPASPPLEGIKHEPNPPLREETQRTRSLGDRDLVLANFDGGMKRKFWRLITDYISYTLLDSYD